MNTTKQEIRQQIRAEKKKYSQQELINLSEPILAELERQPLFQKSKTIMAYHSLADEVFTHRFLEKWGNEKRFLLPVVIGDDILLKEFLPGQDMRNGALNVKEPDSEEFFQDYEKIEVVVVPGVAFDKRGMRMGRGKGFYDRFLPKVPQAHKIGICFPFQIVEEIPADPWDVPMEVVLS